MRTSQNGAESSGPSYCDVTLRPCHSHEAPALVTLPFGRDAIVAQRRPVRCKVSPHPRTRAQEDYTRAVPHPGPDQPRAPRAPRVWDVALQPRHGRFGRRAAAQLPVHHRHKLWSQPGLLRVGRATPPTDGCDEDRARSRQTRPSGPVLRFHPQASDGATTHDCQENYYATELGDRLEA